MLSLVVLGAAAGLVAATPGVARPFPPLNGEAPTAARAELGRLLFFDPILSRDGSLSCAHCHRPDRALSDGLRTARGRGRASLARNTPSLYNVGFKARLMWDRRARSLEAQARLPLFGSNELGADPDELIGRLEGISEYRMLFEGAFVDPISVDTIARALAAFERTLISNNARFDRYAAGDRGALDASERRGFTLFRSLNTRCFECHHLPTFDAPISMGIGVPSDDPGVGAISGSAGQIGQFGVPTLRNVALTAPYMHDGSLATLEAVIEFYREGGGRAHGAPGARVHGHIRAFDISDAEARDLVAFLGTLTDETSRPEVPEQVPSGLPVLEDPR
jgi:cytochrome c peroxidase